ncbi:10689_t:CDS:2 [Ambispora leptoticha]|uniref:10689_t:CDS:1 n=1 Tax=Ambispora leptoticha TaxID=144679 RepID=A0A9N9BF67_9GLOM|nr:10689_t:CDS:2 [Ambispora leptoticha]
METTASEACNSILAKLTQDLNAGNLGKFLHSCGKSTIYILVDCITELHSLEENISDNDNKVNLIHLKADSLIDLSSEKFHSYTFREVPSCWRQLHTDASLVKSICEVHLATTIQKENDQNKIDDNTIKNAWKQVIKTLDMTLLMSGAIGEGRKDLILQLISVVERKLENNSSKSFSSSKLSSSSSSNDDQMPCIKYPIYEHETALSLLSFTAHVKSARPTPFIIKSSISHWPALSTRPWSNIDYLLCVAGEERIVPVEIGAKYTEESWTQRLMEFGEFVRKYIIKDHDSSQEISDNNISYLAQHNLFDQIPRLKEDIIIPDYCFVDTEPLETDNSSNNLSQSNSNVQYKPPSDVIINAWFGPKGTISPMHTDPYHNLLAQVVGEKYIRLYAPEETTKVYPFENDDLLKNTSQVDVENPDVQLFPRFSSAQYVECILRPGDLLYIPDGGITFDR